MSIFGGKKSIFYVKHNSIEIFFANGAKTKKIVFSPVALLDQEILDRKSFEKEINDVIAKIPKQNVILILADEILYYTFTPTLNRLDTQNFFDLAPFDQESLSKKSIPYKKKYILVAANEKYYRSIQFVLERNGWKTIAIIPLFSFLTKGQEVTFDILNKSTNSQFLLHDGNFSVNSKKDRILEPQKLKNSNSALPDEEEEEKPVGKKQYIFLALSLLFFIGAAGFGLYQMQPLPEVKKEKKINVTPYKSTITITSAPNSSTSSAELSREELKIEIQNGTGVAGQGGAVKKELDKLGFVDSVTDNATGTESDNTTVNFSVKVSKAFQEEIINVLETLFTNVIPLTNQNTTEYDVVIITGKTL